MTHRQLSILVVLLTALVGFGISQSMIEADRRADRQKAERIAYRREGALIGCFAVGLVRPEAEVSNDLCRAIAAHIDEKPVTPARAAHQE